MSQTWQEAGRGEYVDWYFERTKTIRQPTIFGDLMENWTDPSGKLSPEEFANPSKIDPWVIRHLGETRMLLGGPINVTNPYHPNGDAVNPYSDSHSAFSLHKWGIDHAASARSGSLVRANDKLGLAVDWDFGSGTEELDDLFEVYLEMAQKMEWTGIGLYPAWNRPGFHTDLRPPDHPSYKYHWFQDYDGTYRALTWKNWKEHILEF